MFPTFCAFILTCNQSKQYSYSEDRISLDNLQNGKRLWPAYYDMKTT